MPPAISVERAHPNSVMDASSEDRKQVKSIPFHGQSAQNVTMMDTSAENAPDTVTPGSRQWNSSASDSQGWQVEDSSSSHACRQTRVSSGWTNPSSAKTQTTSEMPGETPGSQAQSQAQLQEASSRLQDPGETWCMYSEGMAEDLQERKRGRHLLPSCPRSENGNNSEVLKDHQQMPAQTGAPLVKPVLPGLAEASGADTSLAEHQDAKGTGHDESPDTWVL